MYWVIPDTLRRPDQAAPQGREPPLGVTNLSVPPALAQVTRPEGPRCSPTGRTAVPAHTEDTVPGDTRGAWPASRLCPPHARGWPHLAHLPLPTAAPQGCRTQPEPLGAAWHRRCSCLGKLHPAPHKRLCLNSPPIPPPGSPGPCPPCRPALQSDEPQRCRVAAGVGSARGREWTRGSGAPGRLLPHRRPALSHPSRAPHVPSAGAVGARAERSGGQALSKHKDSVTLCGCSVTVSVRAQRGTRSTVVLAWQWSSVLTFPSRPNAHRSELRE